MKVAEAWNLSGAEESRLVDMDLVTRTAIERVGKAELFH
jgi:hypothetical protein